jgi:acyl-CoA dehydrogenase
MSASNVFERLDAQLPLNETERMLLDNVRALARDVIAPNAMRYDKSGEFPEENIRQINALGLNAMFIPEAYGGVELSFTAYLACVREIARACASTGIIWATNFHAMKPLVAYGNEEQKQRLLPRIADGGLASLAITEPHAGSDATAMTTRFTPDGDDIIVDGAKCFITSGDRADLLLLFGRWSEIDDPRGAISVLVFETDTPGFSVVSIEEKMGHKASSTAAIAFDGCRVPRSNLVRSPGDGLEILFGSLNRSRPSVAAHALGIAHAAFGRAVTYVNERRQSGRRIVENQGIQFLLAELATELVLAESWLWRVAAIADSGEGDFGIESSMLKLKATDVAMRITEEAVQLFGGNGYCREYEVERYMRDAKITQIWEGTNQIHKHLIGRSFVEKQGTR